MYDGYTEVEGRPRIFVVNRLRDLARRARCRGIYVVDLLPGSNYCPAVTIMKSEMASGNNGEQVALPWATRSHESGSPYYNCSCLLYVRSQLSSDTH